MLLHAPGPGGRIVFHPVVPLFHWRAVGEMAAVAFEIGHPNISPAPEGAPFCGQSGTQNAYPDTNPPHTNRACGAAEAASFLDARTEVPRCARNYNITEGKNSQMAELLIPQRQNR